MLFKRLSVCVFYCAVMMKLKLFFVVFNNDILFYSKNKPRSSQSSGLTENKKMSWTKFPPSHFGVRTSYYCHHGQFLSLVNSSVCAILSPPPPKNLYSTIVGTGATLNIYTLQVLLVSIKKAANSCKTEKVLPQR